MSLHEFYKAFRTGNKANPIDWIGHLAAAMISIIHIVPSNWILKTIGLLLPVSILLLFLHVIITDLKIDIKDIAVTFFGICYIAIFLMFIPIIHENLRNGKFLIWYVFFTAWGTDIFAYFIGKTLGKHHFTEVSPNKTIEGCVAGVFGAVILSLIYTIILNNKFNFGINYLIVVAMAIILCVIGQIGDFAASTIKRHFDIKDFSNIFPGHGGMLDRIDSVMFIAPFAFCVFTFIL